MDLRKLEHFVAVAEERNFTRAAARLHIVQSGISSSIKALERELGIPLFLRTTQHVELTPAGHALLVQARRILADVADAHQAIARIRGGLIGTLNLGILYGYSPTGIATHLARFRAGHPQVAIQLRGTGAHDIVDHAQRLHNGDLDLAFLLVTRPLPGLVLYPIGTETVLLACHPDHPLATHDTIRLADLAAETTIDFPPTWGVRSAVDAAYAAVGLERQVRFEMNDLSTILDLVRHGLGVAFVPGFLTCEAPGVRFLRVRELPAEFEVALAAPSSRPLSPVSGAFLDTVLRPM
ncbi:DNA-binding transcriptional regulator, LysR family [Nonomuraea solani]|uniref:DNA-binding transcriptional regulator, LysR family n=1 Tax=Nonomuraea solani TaxID=1144553 RepID=A0A1H6BS59_9ACTN|nr:LysR family transcriptional regulator [Nonomuraea solani]SEG63036.1 DNA-binding transcriptional regulator, LysR family [Nonomuraea solani]